MFIDVSIVFMCVSSMAMKWVSVLYVCFPHISRRHNIIAEVAAQLVPGDVGEQRGSWDAGHRPSWCGGRRGGRGTGRGRISPCRSFLTDGRLLQAVAHHHKCVEA